MASDVKYVATYEVERVTGIEPAQLAWKARTLPLSYTRRGAIDKTSACDEQTPPLMRRYNRRSKWALVG